MSSELDLFVSPLGGPILTGDEAHSMDASEVPIDECVSGLGLVVGTLGQSQMPFGVVIP